MDLLKVAKPEGSIEDMVEIAPRIYDDRVVQLHRQPHMVGDGATWFIVMEIARR